MKKIKHSKYRNTGVLFELLVRQITQEILSSSDKEPAKNIVKEFFSKSKELSKELRLYKMILDENHNTEPRAEKFVDMVCSVRSKLNESKLNKEKYNLVKIIKEKYDIDRFMSSPITNYKELASIYKLFESTISDEEYDVSDVFQSKYNLVEHVMNGSIHNKDEKIQEKINERFETEDKNVRLLTYKILVENFNKKYTNLNTQQKSLLREFINNVSNTTKFADYFNNERVGVIKSLSEIHNTITDKVTRIKLKETINTLSKMKIGKKISDENVSVLMMSYELQKELKEVVGRNECK